MLLTTLLSETGSDAPALVFEGSIATRRELSGTVRALASGLETAGVEAGSKVIVALPNSPAFLISMMAVNACGAVFMPINPQLTPEERHRIDDIARPDFVLAEHGQIELLPGVWLTRTDCVPYANDDLTDVAAIIFTSGTTGTPKGVMMSEGALLANARSVANYLGLSKADQTLVFLPAYYTYTLSQIFSTWLGGGTVVLLRNLRYPVEAFAAIANHGITGFGGVPTTLSILASHAPERGVEQPRLRYVLNAGGPLATSLVSKVQRVFSGASLFNNYGCTEIGPRATAINFSMHPEKTGSIGRAIPGVTVTIVHPDLSVAAPHETGEIVLSGASLMKGYYRDQKTTLGRMSPYGFHTGDYGYVDSEGFLYFEGRLDDIFKSGGEKVSAREIEDVLLSHEAIAEAAVVGVEEPTLGAVPVAYVVLRHEATSSERDLRAFCAQHLSRYKVPKTVHFVGELHKTATGKIQKHRLRDAYL